MGDIEVDRLKLKEASKKKKYGEKIAKAARKKRSSAEGFNPICVPIRRVQANRYS